MPLDVLGQLQEASANVSDEQLKSSLDNIIQSASESGMHLQALKGIMAAVTEGGNSLSNSLEKIVFYFEKFEARANSAKNALLGIGSSMQQSFDTRPLNDVNSLLIKIEKQQKSLSQKIDFFPNINQSLSGLNQVHSDLMKIQKVAAKGIDINVNYSGAPKIQKEVIRGQAFASGGAVRYTPSNSRKAKTGGQFTGKRTGDREIAFVNAGQAIITERAVKSGARQAGMSVGSYISNLNSGNLSKIKRGRSFANGTPGDKETRIQNLQHRTVMGDVKSSKTGDDLKKFTDQFRKAIEVLAKTEGGVVAQDVNKIIEILKKGGDNKSKMMGYVQQRLKIEGLSNISELKETPDILEQIVEQMQSFNEQLDENRDKILSTKQAMEKWQENSTKKMQRSIEQLGTFGKMFVDTKNKAGMFAASLVVIADKMQKNMDTLSKWFIKQSELNVSLAKFNSTASGFNIPVDSLTAFKKEMNLTRQQSAQLTDTFRTIGVEGNISFSQIETLAAGIKDQFGKLDITLLKQAVQHIKDIPKEQVQVLITGQGSFDDKANLIANLLEGGKLQATAQLITKGAFGSVQGATPQVSDSDKQTIALQQHMNASLDNLSQTVNDLVPTIAKGVTIWGAQLIAMGASLASGVAGIASTWMGIKGIMSVNESILSEVSSISRQSSSGGSIEDSLDVSGRRGRGAGRSGGRGLGRGGSRGLGGGNRGLGRGAGSFGGRGFGRGLRMPTRGLASGGRAVAGLAKGGSMARGLMPMVGKIGSIAGKAMAAAGPFMLIGAALSAIGGWVQSIADDMKKADTEKRGQSAKANLDEYGIDASTHKVSAGRRVGQASATVGGSALKGAGTGLAIGAAVGSIIPGIGTAVGAAIGGAVGTIVGAVSGVVQAIKDDDATKIYNAAAQKQQAIFKEMEKNKAQSKKNAALLGMRVGDTKKAILTLAPIMKRIEMYSKGLYSQSDRMRGKVASAEKELLMKTGGSSSSIKQQASFATGHAASAFTRDVSGMNAEKQRIINDKNMGDAEKQMALLKIKDEQIKKYEELIQVLQRSMVDYKKLPSVISATLSQDLSNALMGLANNNMTGSSDMASANANLILKQGYAKIKEAQSAISANMKNMDKVAKAIENQNKKANTETSKAVDEYNKSVKDGDKITVKRDSKGMIDTKSLQQIKKKVNEFKMAREQAINNSNDTALQGLQSSSKMALAEGAAVTSESTKIQTASEQQFKKMDINAIKKSNIERIQKTLLDLQGLQKNPNLSKEQREALSRQISELQNHKKAIQGLNKDSKQEVVFQAVNSAGQSLQTSAANLEKAANARLFKSGSDFAKRFPNAAQMQKLSLSTESLVNAQGVQKQMEIKRMQQLSEVFAEYERQANVFASAVSLIYKSADIMYRDVVSKNLSTTESFRAMSGEGGADAVTKTTKAQYDVINATLNGLSKAKHEIDEAAALSEKSIDPKDKNFSKLTKEQQEYVRSLHELAKARRASMEEPENEAKRKAVIQAENRHKKATTALGGAAQVNKLILDNGNFRQAQGKAGIYNKSVIESTQKLASVKADIMKLAQEIPNKIQRAVAIDPRRQMAQAHIDVSTARGELSSQIGDVSGMYKSAREIGDLVNKEFAERLKIMRKSRDAQLNELEKQKNAILAKGSAATKQQLEILRTYETQKQIINANYQAQETQAIKDHHKNLADKIKGEYDNILGAVDRQKEGLQIQKDLLSTIGAPFEMLLDVEKQIVENAKTKANVQQQALQKMIASGVKGEKLEQQKLKTAKAQATVLKAAFGAQRDSLDKMLGKMMGTFDQVGGIFGPDGEKMMARKFGQGYSVNGAGMAVSADPDKSHQSYKERAFANSRTAMMGNKAFGMMEGHQAYSTDVIETPKNGEAAQAMKYIDDVVTKNMQVGNLILKKGNIPGASKGGYVWGGTIRAFSKGGPSDPRDNIPALLRKGEFVLTPEDVTNAVSLGKQFESAGAFGGTQSGGGQQSGTSKILASILGVITAISKSISQLSTTTTKIQSQNNNAKKNAPKNVTEVDRNGTVNFSKDIQEQQRKQNPANLKLQQLIQVAKKQHAVLQKMMNAGIKGDKLKKQREKISAYEGEIKNRLNGKSASKQNKEQQSQDESIVKMKRKMPKGMSKGGANGSPFAKKGGPGGYSINVQNLLDGSAAQYLREEEAAEAQVAKRKKNKTKSKQAPAQQAPEQLDLASLDKKFKQLREKSKKLHEQTKKMFGGLPPAKQGEIIRAKQNKLIPPLQQTPEQLDPASLDKKFKQLREKSKKLHEQTKKMFGGLPPMKQGEIVRAKQNKSISVKTQGTAVQNTNDQSSNVGDKPADMMVTGANNLKKEVDRVYKQAGIVSAGYNGKNAKGDTSSKKGDSPVTSIEKDVHEILQILKGKGNGKGSSDAAAPSKKSESQKKPSDSVFDIKKLQIDSSKFPKLPKAEQKKDNKHKLYNFTKFEKLNNNMGLNPAALKKLLGGNAFTKFFKNVHRYFSNLKKAYQQGGMKGVLKKVFAKKDPATAKRDAIKKQAKKYMKQDPTLSPRKALKMAQNKYNRTQQRAAQDGKSLSQKAASAFKRGKTGGGISQRRGIAEKAANFVGKLENARLRGKAGRGVGQDSNRLIKSTNKIAQVSQNVKDKAKGVATSITGNMSAKDLNKKAAGAFRYFRNQHIKQFIAPKRRDVINKQAKRIRTAHPAVSKQHARKLAERAYDTGKLKNSKGESFRDVHQRQAVKSSKKIFNKEKFQQFRQNLQESTKDNSLFGRVTSTANRARTTVTKAGKAAVQTIKDDASQKATGKVSSSRLRKLVKQDNASRIHDGSKVNANLSKYSVMSQEDWNKSMSKVLPKVTVKQKAQQLQNDSLLGRANAVKRDVVDGYKNRKGVGQYDGFAKQFGAAVKEFKVSFTKAVKDFSKGFSGGFKGNAGGSNNIVRTTGSLVGKGAKSAKDFVSTQTKPLVDKAKPFIDKAKPLATKGVAVAKLATDYVRDQGGKALDAGRHTTRNATAAVLKKTRVARRAVKNAVDRYRTSYHNTMEGKQQPVKGAAAKTGQVIAKTHQGMKKAGAVIKTQSVNAANKIKQTVANAKSAYQAAKAGETVTTTGFASKVGSGAGKFVKGVGDAKSAYQAAKAGETVSATGFGSKVGSGAGKFVKGVGDAKSAYQAAKAGETVSATGFGSKVGSGVGKFVKGVGDAKSAYQAAKAGEIVTATGFASKVGSGAGKVVGNTRNAIVKVDNKLGISKGTKAAGRVLGSNKSLGVQSAIIGSMQLHDAYKTINDPNASMVDSAQSFLSGTANITRGVGRFMGGAKGGKAMKAAAVLNLAANIPALFNGKNNPQATAQAAQNLIQLGMPMRRTNMGRGGGAAQGAVLLGTGINMLANNYMKDGKAKNSVTGVGDALIHGGTAYSNMAMNAATFGLSGAVDTAFDLHRKFNTKEGRERMANVGTGAEIIDSATKGFGIQSAFQLGGALYDVATGGTEGRENTDISAMLQDIHLNVGKTHNTNMNLGAGLVGDNKKKYDALALRHQRLTRKNASMFGDGLSKKEQKELQTIESDMLNIRKNASPQQQMRQKIMDRQRGAQIAHYNKVRATKDTDYLKGQFSGKDQDKYERLKKERAEVNEGIQSIWISDKERKRRQDRLNQIDKELQPFNRVIHKKKKEEKDKLQQRKKQIQTRYTRDFQIDQYSKQADGLLASNVADDFHKKSQNAAHAIVNDRNKRATAFTTNVRNEVAAYDQNVKKYESMTDEQKNSEQGKSLKASIDSQQGAMARKKKILQHAEFNEKKVKKSSDIFQKIHSAMGEKDKKELQAKQQRLRKAKEELQGARDDERGNISKEEYQRRKKNVEAAAADLANFQGSANTLSKDFYEGKISPEELLKRAKQHGIQVSDADRQLLQGKDEQGRSYSPEVLSNLLAGKNEQGQYLQMATSEDLATYQKQQQQAAPSGDAKQQQTSVPQANMVDVGQSDDIGTNVQKIVRLLEKNLGAVVSGAPSSSHIISTSNTGAETYNYTAPTVDRNYADLRKDEVISHSLISSEAERQRQHLDDASGALASKRPVATKLESPVANGSTSESKTTEQKTNQSGNMKVEVILRLDDKEFEKLLMVKAAKIVDMGMFKNK